MTGDPVAAATPTPEPSRGIDLVTGPSLRWSARARSIAELERELARLWVQPQAAPDEDGDDARRPAVRTSVMNLVVIVRRPEIGERAAATIAGLTGRAPSRTLVVSAMDPDGPSWLDARIEAFCMLPRPDAVETCSEAITIVAGGDSGRHIAAIVAPLLIHDLPVTVWWPGEPPLGSRQAGDVLALADRLVVDGSGWAGDGLDRLVELARFMTARDTAVFDFAHVRQARWREAIAAAFDRAELLPYLRAIRRVTVTYAARDLDAAGPGGLEATNVVKPVYHVAWLASRLGWSVASPLAAVAGRVGRSANPSAGLVATLRAARHDVAVTLGPVASTARPGTTLRVELIAERRGSELRVEVTADVENVCVRVWRDGSPALDQTFRGVRRTDVDLLMEAVETSGPDPVAHGAIRAAGALAGRSSGPAT